MITTDRVLGGMLAAFGGILLLIIIPDQIAGRPGEPTDPSLFPRIAGWMLVVLGALQVVFSGTATSLPDRRDFLRFSAAVALLIGAAIVLPFVGFLPTAVGLMLATVLLVHERRLLWAGISVLGVPLIVWALFELVLQRPLP